jgi:hypothetical protein
MSDEIQFELTSNDARCLVFLRLTPEAVVQLKLNDGEWVTPQIGQTVDWGEGVEEPIIMVTKDQPNPRKDVFNIRLCVFGTYYFAQGRRESWAELVPPKPDNQGGFGLC